VGGTPEEVARWKSEVPADNLVFYGFVSPDKVYDYMGTFDAMLAPFQPNVLVGDRKVDIARWMSPLKIFEYMAGGKPIIASNLPVLQEVLTDNENALLTDAADPHGWVAKINRLADDEALRRKLGQQAQKDFFSHYTWEKRAEILLHTLQPRQTIREKVQGITTPNR
jgi:glycosyltransferase involved in cell wall biosynthesis